MVRVMLAAVLGVAAALPVRAQGTDPNVGRNLAAACASCHGTGGVSQAGMPMLAGVQKTRLIRKMLDFKAGKLSATVMQQIAKGYTDEQIGILASYFEAPKN